MNLKNKILQLLKEKKFTYQQLAEHLNITDKQLDHALETKTLEVRTLELISKELRIPLYSFFREKADVKNLENESFYNMNIWSTEEFKLKKEITILKQEIDNLRAELRQNELLIQALEEQIVKKG